MQEALPDPVWAVLEIVPETCKNDLVAPKLIELRKRRVLIGRQPGNDVVLDSNPCISATHCCISYLLPSSFGDGSDGRRSEAAEIVVSLADCSSNGCFVNGAKIGKGRIHSPLVTGDVIHLVLAAPNKNDRYNLAYLFRRVLEQPGKGNNVIPADEENHQSTTALDHRNQRQQKDEPPKASRTALKEENGSAGDEEIPLCFMAVPSSMSRAVDVASLPKVVVEPSSLSSASPSEVRDETTMAAAGAPTGIAGFAPEVTTKPGSWRGMVAADEARSPASDQSRNGGGSVEEGAVKIWRQSIDDVYELDKEKPLGTGSFGTVYRGRLRQERSAAGPVRAVKILNKKRVYLTEECLLPQDRTHDATIVRILQLEQLLDEKGLDGAADLRQIEEKVPFTRAAKLRETGHASSTAKLKQELRELRRGLTPRLLGLIDKELKHRRRQQCEIEILTAVRHPHIVRLHQVVDSPDTLGFVLDLAEGGELFQLLFSLGSLPEFLTKLMVFQVLEAVAYLHQLGIAHRDIKLENLLLAKPINLEMIANAQILSHRGRKAEVSNGDSAAASAIPRKRPRNFEGEGGDAIERQQQVFIPQIWWPQVMVSDFGLSRIVSPEGDNGTTSGGGAQDVGLSRAGGQLMTTMCGTPIYAAPEITITSLRQDAAGYTPAVDLFSVGAAAFALLTARPPFPYHKDPLTGRATSKINYAHPLSWERRQAPGSSDDTASNAAPLVPLLFRQAKDAPISDAGRELVGSLLSMQPKKRMTAAQALRHRWFDDVHRIMALANEGDRVDVA